MYKIFKFHLFFVLTFCLSSCEYELSKLNIIDLIKPTENHQFDLSIISEKDTINVFQYSTFEYNINTYGLDVKSAKFSMNGKEWDINSTSGTFSISPQEFTPNYYLLTLKIYTNSGTGSIAEYFDAEGYFVEKKWIVYIDSTLPASIVVTKSISEKGFLKFTWPKCNRVDFVDYVISGWPSYCNISKTTGDRNFLSAEDSTYIGGIYEFKVDIFLKGNRTVSGLWLKINEPYPTLSYESLNIDSLRLHWPKSKYRAKYSLLNSQGNFAFQTYKDSTYTVVQPGIGNSVYYTLFTAPTQFDWLDSRYRDNYSQKAYVMGNLLLSTTVSSRYGYNSIENVLYANNGTGYEIDCYDASTMTRKNHLNNSKVVYSGFYSCPNNSTKVAVLATDNIYVYENSKLLNPVIIPYNSIGQLICNFTMTDNGLIGFTTTFKYELIRISDKITIATIPINDTPFYLGTTGCSTSNDGKYYNVVTRNGLHLYKIENGIVSQIYQDNRAYTSTLFNPKNPNELLVSIYNSNIIELRNSSDFSLIQTIVMPDNSNIIRNIDPDTGYLFLTSSKRNYLFDLTMSKILFSMNAGSVNPLCCFKNIMFTSNGYYQDLSNYIKK